MSTPDILQMHQIAYTSQDNGKIAQITSGQVGDLRVIHTDMGTAPNHN